MIEVDAASVQIAKLAAEIVEWTQDKKIDPMIKSAALKSAAAVIDNAVTCAGMAVAINNALNPQHR